MARNPRGNLLDVTLLALRLGFTAFGGPAAHVAMLRDEVVRRRKWLDEERFLEIVGATNLIPGPNSTEMVMHVGLLRAGWRGLILAGTAFILPAALIVGVLAHLYVVSGTTPEATWMLHGVKPVVIAVILHATIGLLRAAARDAFTIAIGIAALAAALFTAQDTLVIVAAGVVAALPYVRGRGPMVVAAPILTLATTAVPSGLITLALTLLKIGALLYGSGYVLVGYLRDEFVVRLRWLTDAQLLDAVAVGQVTPGPLLTTATFVGYLTHGVTGAAVATVAIFLPAFLFVPLLHHSLEKMRSSRVAAAFLRGVNAASIAVMIATALLLGRSAITDVTTALLATASLLLLVRGVSSTWLIGGGIAAGYLMSLA